VQGNREFWSKNGSEVNIFFNLKNKELKKYSNPKGFEQNAEELPKPEMG
jgi:hypothetical protein